jgi:hypothetical protein
LSGVTGLFLLSRWRTTCEDFEGSALENLNANVLVKLTQTNALPACVYAQIREVSRVAARLNRE